MSRLHKKYSFGLDKKIYLSLFFLFLYGFYKNGILLAIHGYNSWLSIFKIILFPVFSYGIGFIFDKKAKKPNLFPNRLLALVFCCSIPTSTNLILYCGVLFLFFLLLDYFKEIDKFKINKIVLFHLILVLVLLLFHSYSYMNALESSQEIQYSLVDALFGRNVSGLFHSNIVLLACSLLLFSFDSYYKKEIPILGYAFYCLTLVFYSIFKGDILLLLRPLLSGSVWFALIFVAPFLPFSPERKKDRILYSAIIGILILPFSLLFNFYEGVYISILFGNLLMHLLKHFTKTSISLFNLSKKL